MIIHEPQIERRGDTVRLSAQIDSSLGNQRVWFEYPAHLEPMLSKNADAFLVSLLQTGMALHEDIEVRGTLSPRLLEGIATFQEYFSRNLPHYFKPVRIKCDAQRAESPAAGKRAIVIAFSGGVDSFYTLFRHLPSGRDASAPAVTHLMYLLGYDMPLSARASYELLAQRYETLAHELGIELIRVATNATELVVQTKIDWGFLFGPPLAGAGLALSPFIERFYISADLTYDTFTPRGSTPVTDPLLSTEISAIEHYGADTTRVEKTRALIGFPESHNLLRVCLYHNAEGTDCCRCLKCIRTMITLEMEGAQGVFKTFPRARNRLLRYWVKPNHEASRAVVQQMLGRSVELGRYDIASELHLSLRASHHPILFSLQQRYTRYDRAIWNASRSIKRALRTFI